MIGTWFIYRCILRLVECSPSCAQILALDVRKRFFSKTARQRTTQSRLSSGVGTTSKGSGRSVWPGNSPYWSTIENIWAIVQGELDKREPPTSKKALVSNLQNAWRQISAETLDNLVCGMPERRRECIRLRGGCIGK